MKDVFDFLRAALPLISIGLLRLFVRWTAMSQTILPTDPFLFKSRLGRPFSCLNRIILRTDTASEVRQMCLKQRREYFVLRR